MFAVSSLHFYRKSRLNGPCSVDHAPLCSHRTFHESSKQTWTTGQGLSDSEWKKGVDNREFCTLLFLLLDRSFFLFLTRGIKQGSWMSADSTRVYFMGSFGFLGNTARAGERERRRALPIPFIHFQSVFSCHWWRIKRSASISFSCAENMLVSCFPNFQILKLIF